MRYSGLMVERHRKAALALTGMVSVAAIAAMAVMYKLVPDALWASLANLAILIPATIYIIGLWLRNLWLRRATAAYLEAGIAEHEALVYTAGKMRRILLTEPVLYAAILYHSTVQRFNGYIMSDQAAPAFVDQGFTEALGSHTMSVVENLLPHIETSSPEERLRLVMRTVAVARKHGAAETAAYIRSLGPHGLDALERGLALEYAQALAS